MQKQLQIEQAAAFDSARRVSRHKLLQRVWLIFLQIFMTFLVISFLVPTFWMLSSSLKVSTEIFTHPIQWLPSTPQWRNYTRAFELLPLTVFIQNTLIIVFFAVIGTIISSAMVAYSFARINWPGRRFWFALMLSTMMMPDVITLVPRFILFRSLPGFGFQGSPTWLDTFLPLIVPYWTGISGLYVFLMHQFLRGIPLELEDAAAIDGASRFRILVQILMPLSKPVIATIAVFSLLQHYNDYMNPLIYIRSMQKWPMALGLAAYNDAYVQNWEVVFAASTIMVLPMIIVFLFAQRYFVQGIAMTGFGGR
jgi:multiple sugar transport system permease protein